MMYLLTAPLLVIYKKIYQKISDIFHQEAFHNITSEQCKLRAYELLKNKIEIENYVLQITNPKIRTTLSIQPRVNEAKRVDSQKIPKQLHFCLFCQKSVESEIHFLIKCPGYQPLDC